MSKKDPAFLFYPQDFLTGTMFMNNEQVGIYIRLLCAQHQHGGIIDRTSFNSIIGENEIVKSKFIETEDGYFNNRLMEEMEKRNAKSCNMSANAHKRWDLHKQKKSKSNAIALRKDMQPENENESIDIIDESFENFRKLYQGTKRGLKIEFDNFKKKHKDWKEVLPLLEPAVKKEIEWRKQKRDFTPQWKNLSTWINQRCWEQEFENTPPPKKELKEIPASAIFNNVQIDYGNYPHNED
jgi:uncharacterized protein YdaU (DUF1376 family)